MSKALALSGSPDVTETARLADIMDGFFDCLNLSSFTAGNIQGNLSRTHGVQMTSA